VFTAPPTIIFLLLVAALLVLLAGHNPLPEHYPHDVDTDHSAIASR
jgi:hypothetical protein